MAYPSDVKDGASWPRIYAWCAKTRRNYALRDVFTPLCYLTGDLPPWATVYQQWKCWRDAVCLII